MFLVEYKSGPVLTSFFEDTEAARVGITSRLAMDILSLYSGRNMLLNGRWAHVSIRPEVFVNATYLLVVLVGGDSGGLFRSFTGH